MTRIEVPIRTVDHRAVTTVTLNGVPVSLVVDSGGFFSLLSASTADRLHLDAPEFLGMRVGGLTGGFEGKVATVRTMGFVGAELPDMQFIVGGNELNAGAEGILGRNILSVADTEFDLGQGIVRLSFPEGDCGDTNFAYWAKGSPVIVAPMLAAQNRRDTAIRVTVRINGKDTPALFDTGAPQSSLTLEAARVVGLRERDLQPFGRVGGIGDGHAKSWTATLASFELRGEKITNNRLQISDVKQDDFGAILGLDYFLSHRIYVSRLQRKVYITWNGGPVFALSRTASGDDGAAASAPRASAATDDADTLARRGAAELEAGDLAHALEDLDRACELEPSVALHFLDRARVHLAMRKAAAAIADLDTALQLDPALAEARLRRAQIRNRAGDGAAARADLERLDLQLPAAAPMRADLAELHAARGRVPEALRQFELWLNSHPRDARRAAVLNGRCWTRTRLGIDLLLALDDCREAVKLDRGHAGYADTLGWTQLRLGNAQEAKASFDAAIAEQARPFAFYGRGLAEHRLNDPAGGDRDLAEARRLRPTVDADVRKEGFDTTH